MHIELKENSKTSGQPLLPLHMHMGCHKYMHTHEKIQVGPVSKEN